MKKTGGGEPLTTGLHLLDSEPWLVQNRTMAKPELKEECIRLRVEQRLSLNEISRATGAPKGTLSAWLRLHPLSPSEVRAKKDKGRLRHKGRQVSEVDTPPVRYFTKRPSLSYLSRSGVGSAIEWFLSRGYDVSVPVEPTHYDLVVGSDDGLKRVQIKTTNHKDRGSFKVNTYWLSYDPDAECRKTYSKRRKKPYTKEQIDLLYVLTGDGVVYLIPLEALNGQQTIVLGAKYKKFKIPSDLAEPGGSLRNCLDVGSTPPEGAV